MHGSTTARRLASAAAGGLGRVVLLAAVLALGATFLPAVFGYHRYVLVGGSMEPTIHKGSLVFDEVVSVERLRRGDVITYIPPTSNEPVTHRIISVDVQPDGTRVFRTKGDHNEAPDLRPFTLREPRQARVKFAIPYLGWLFVLLSLQAARIFILTLPAVLLAAWGLVALWREGGRLVAEREAALVAELEAGSEAS
jgi:signal peptidase I